MLLGYVSDENYAALEGVAIELRSASVWQLVQSWPSGAVHADVPTGSYEVCLSKSGFGSKRVQVTVNEAEPIHFRLLSDRLLGYAWPKWCRAGEPVEFRMHSIEPYKPYDGRGLILLCRTSNPGGDDLQAQALVSAQPGGELLYERIARLAAGEWGRGAELGLVVGATYPREVARVRELAPTLPLLIPGIGAQGGDAAATVRAGWRPGGPIVVNSSRAVLYASAGDDFAAAARAVAAATRAQLRPGSPAA